MRQLFDKTILSMAIAIFSMFFGAGNSIFPLILGMETQGQFNWAFLGLILTAIGGPLLGLIGATLYEGRCLNFFYRAGKIPGTFLIGITFCLLGPFAVLPRCITVAYAAIQPIISWLPLWLFGLIFCTIAFFCCLRRHFLLPILGYILSPMLIICLLFIIFQGGSSTLPLSESDFSAWSSFSLGLSTGYDTMDLIAAIYLSSGIWTMVQIYSKDNSPLILKTTLKAGTLGCIFLGLIYYGLVHAAARFSPFLQNVPPEQLMTHLANLTLGPTMGLIANLAIALACLTTVISLAMTISDIACKEIFQGRPIYTTAISINLIITAGMANLGFGAIMHIIHPFLTVCYPMIICLTVYNIASKLHVKSLMPRILNNP